MDIRPQDLPELRAESLLDQANNGERFIQVWSHDNAAPEGREAEFGRERWRYEIQRLGSAELFWITEAMADLAFAAAPSLPSFTVQPEDLPADTGLMVFDKPIPDGVRWSDGTLTPLRAILWSCMARSGKPAHVTGADSVTFSGYVDRADLEAMALKNASPVAAERIRTGPRLVCPASVAFSAPFGAEGWTELPETGSVAVVLPVMLTAWLLMRQPLARVVEVEADRASRKRLRRANQDPAAVRVIELRRPPSNGADTESGRAYHHTWIVKGHWRNHWHPKRQVHRPVWIAPHVKGPEGAPMIGGEKVYAWKR